MFDTQNDGSFKNRRGRNEITNYVPLKIAILPTF
jgi:hypothetical protein